MISFSKLLLNQQHFGDTLRYHPDVQGRTKGTATGRGPIVVWNCTRTCNLNCKHCYAEAVNTYHSGELSTEEARHFMETLVLYQVPVLLLSGGEPLMRKDIWELIEYGNQIGLWMVISTNGTLIDRDKAKLIKELGISYAGISLDGLEEVNDSFRGASGAFDKAMEGFRNCREAGQKTGLRLTLSKTNYKELPAIFDLIEKERIQRVCFYHLVYSGRGSGIASEDLTHDETRESLNFIIDKTMDFHSRGIETEILTVDNHCDGIYLYQHMKKRDEEQAEKILRLITTNGGNNSGSAISSVDWEGNVYIDQFTRDIPLGNIREMRFGDIWDGSGNPFLEMLRGRKKHLKGRCASCIWLNQCNGNFRARAQSTGDFWASDPACYLTDEEIGI
jgi:radical SAM protein with 4Fe4S-binding SPASM domain